MWGWGEGGKGDKISAQVKVCVTVFPEMSKYLLKMSVHVFKTRATVFQQQQTHLEPMSETVRHFFFSKESQWLQQSIEAPLWVQM